MGEVVDLFGVRFVGQRDLRTGRIYVENSAESRKALAELGKVAREMREAQTADSSVRK